MPKGSDRRRRQPPTALSMPWAAWVIVLAAICLFVAYVILQPIGHRQEVAPGTSSTPQKNGAMRRGRTHRSEKQPGRRGRTIRLASRGKARF
jgi:hypothetical protein